MIGAHSQYGNDFPGTPGKNEWTHSTNWPHSLTSATAILLVLAPLIYAGYRPESMEMLQAKQGREAQDAGGVSGACHDSKLRSERYSYSILKEP